MTDMANCYAIVFACVCPFGFVEKLTNHSVSRFFYQKTLKKPIKVGRFSLNGVSGVHHGNG